MKIVHIGELPIYLEFQGSVDRGAWRATAHGLAKSRIDSARLTTNSRESLECSSVELHSETPFG